MWADHGVEFFIHPAMQASPEMGFPEFFRQDRDGQPRGVIQVVKAGKIMIKSDAQRERTRGSDRGLSASTRQGGARRSQANAPPRSAGATRA